MPIARFQMPDGRIGRFEVPEGTTPEQAQQLIAQHLSGSYNPMQNLTSEEKPDTGFTGAFKSSLEGLKGEAALLAGKTGLMDEAAAEKYYKEKEEAAKKKFKPTTEGWTEAPWEKFKETLGGSLPYMAAPVIAGAGVAAAPVTGAAATALGLGAAGLASATQFTGSNLARQMEEGKTLKETDLLAAGAAAIPQAALDTLSLKMIPGIGRIFGAAGKKITPEMAKQIAEQGILKTTGAIALQTGKTAGIEGATEAAQQLFERLQAGLDITDEAARSEYFDNFIGGAVLGGTLGGPGHFIERSRIKQQAAEDEYAKKQQALLEARTAEEQEKAAKAEEKARAELLKAQQKTGDILGENIKASALPAQERMSLREEDAARAAEVEPGMPTYADVERNKNQLETLASQTLAKLDKAIESGDTATYKQLAPQLENIRVAIDAAEKQLTALPKPAAIEDRGTLEAQLSKLQREFKKYTGTAFNKDKLDAIANKIDAVTEKLKNVKEPVQGSLFGTDKKGAPTYTERAPTEEEKAQAVKSQEVIDAEALQEEIEKSRGIADQYMRLPTADEYKAQLKALRDEKARLEKSGEPWYAKGRLAEVERLIQEIQPKTQAAVAAQAKGEKVRPVESIKQEQNATLDEIQKRLEMLKEAPNDTNLASMAEKASQDYIMLALQEMDAERAKQNMGRLSDQQVLGFVQELRRAFAPVIANKSTGMLDYPQEGRRVIGESPLAKQLEKIKQQFAQGEEEFTLKTQYGQPRRETREELAAATKGIAKVEKTPEGYRVVEPAALTPREREAGKKVDVSNIGNIEQGELFAESAQKAVQKANVAALEKEVADLEKKFKADNSGKNIKAAIETRKQLEAKKEELKDAKEGKPAELQSLATVRTTTKRFIAFVNTQAAKFRNTLALVEKALDPKVTADVERAHKLVAQIQEINLKIENARVLATPPFPRSAGPNVARRLPELEAKNEAAYQQALKERAPAIAELKRLQAEKVKLLTELRGIAPEVSRPLSTAEKAAAKKQEVVQSLIQDLESSYEANRNVLESRSLALRKMFSEPLENKLIADINKTKEQLAEWEKFRNGLPKNAKSIASAQAEINRLQALIDKAEGYLGDIRSRETTLYVQEQENRNNYVQKVRAQLRKILKDAPADVLADADRRVLESVAKENEELAKRVKEKREAEQASLQKLGGLSSTKRVLAEVPSAAVKSENISKFGKQIREKEALLATLPENTRGYIDLAREIAQLKEKRAAEITPVRVPVTTTRIAPRTAEEKLEAVQTRAEQAAKERAEDRKRQQERLATGQSKNLELVKKAFSMLKGKIEKTEKEIAGDVKKVSAITQALENAKTEKGKAHWQSKLDKLNKSIEAKDLATTQESLKKKLKQLQEKGLDADLLLKVLGEAPAKSEKKKPIKTGVAKPAKPKKAKVDFDEDAVEHGIRYDDYMFVKQGLEFGFKAREEAAHGGKGVSQAAAQAEVDKVKLPKGLKVVVLNRLSGNLRDDVIAQGRNPENVLGGVMPNGGVFIVAENHADAKEVKKTIAHELIGHLGVESVIGEEGMRALSRRVAKQDGGVFALADKLGVGEDALGAYAAAKQMGKTDAEAADVALREVIAHAEEARVDRSFLGKAGEFIKAMVGAVRAGLRKLGLDLDISTNDIYKILRDARKDFDQIVPGVYKKENGEIMFKNKPAEYGPGGEAVARAEGEILAAPKNFEIPKSKAEKKAFLGSAALWFEQKFVRGSAGLMQALESKVDRDSLLATKTKYFIAMYNQKHAWVGTALSKGVPQLVEKTRKDGSKETVLEAGGGANVKDIVEALGKADWGNAEGVRNVWSLHRIKLRADDVGLEKLNFSKDQDVTQKLLDDAEAVINAPGNEKLKAAIANADKIYNQYNRDLMNFLASTGAISKELAKKLVEKDNFIPYYRQKEDGTVQLDLGEGKRVNIGNIKTQPYLQQLVGGDERIVDAYTGILQNTNMIMDMALSNLATRNTAFALAETGLLEPKGSSDMVIRTGPGPASDKVLRFRVQPVGPKDTGERHVVVNTDAVGVPAQFVVEGLAGINTTVPTMFRFLGMPAQTLRKFVTVNPAYALRQVVKDPMVGIVANGLDTDSFLKTLKTFGKELANRDKALSDIERLGIVGSNVFTGTVEDSQKRMLEIANGGPGFMSKLDTLALAADAATRQTAFNNFLKQGLSEMEAVVATYEMMPFTQRGTSRSLYLLSTTIPFLNAQIQGLNVLYKAMRGKATFQEKLRIKQKLFQRAALMSAATLAYALYMQDDDAYKNATDDERYNNWFVYTPLSKQPIKIPTPFEVGILFKALPEAIVNAATGDRTAGEAVQAMGKLFLAAAPIGPSSIPTAVKTPLEIMMNYSIYGQHGIVSERLKRVAPEERFTDNTTEIAKMVGGATGKIPVLGEYLSPVQLDYLVRGYTGSTVLAIASLTNPIFKTGGEAPESRGFFSSDTPIVGGFFQPSDANGLINRAYKDVEKISQAAATYKKLEDDGRTAEAEAYANKQADLLDLAPMSGDFRTRMGELAANEREVRSNPYLTPKEKRDLLDAIKQERIARARDLLSARG